MNKKLIVLLIFVCTCVLAFSACAPAETGTSYNPETSKPVVTENSRITVQHIIAGFAANYAFDYIEDKENGYGCYVYDGNESGSIFCFKLGQ